MSINKEIRDSLPENTIVLDNTSFDNSIVGVSTDGRVVYDFDTMVQELMEDEDWTVEESIEWIEYNTIRALPYLGANAPIICERLQL